MLESNLGSEVDHFLHFAISAGIRYVACGGSCSRLEHQLERVGETRGLRAEVFATTTGVFVCVSLPGHRSPQVVFARIKSTLIRLGDLQTLESLFHALIEGKTTLRAAEKSLKKSRRLKGEYPAFSPLLASFVLGVCASILASGLTWAALPNGVITMASFGLIGILSKKRNLSGISCDFFACLFALSAGSLASLFLGLRTEQLVVGTFILLVPGLTLTTAISELADHDFISGTSRLMRGLLTLLAMGTAELIFRQASLLWQPASPLLIRRLSQSADTSTWITATSYAFLLLSFALIFQTPRKALVGALVSGVTGWFILRAFENPQLFVLATFCSSFVVGVLSFALSWLQRLPSQIFAVPGILALVPGMIALSSFRSFTTGQEGDAIQLAFHVISAAGAIAFGLFTSRALFNRWPVVAPAANPRSGPRAKGAGQTKARGGT